jgi:hypothetical protein
MSFDEPNLDSVVLDDDVIEGAKRFHWGIHGLVGHDKEPTEFCCQFRKLKGCLGRNGSHDVVDVYGHDFHGKCAVQRVFLRCYSPKCRACFRKGWAKREADRGEARLVKLGTRFGLIEHGTVSVPLGEADRLLRMGVDEFKKYWRMVEALLLDCGVLGGLDMFHPARYNRVDGWHWSPHWHFLGVIVPSYGRCRRCTDRKCIGRNREFLRCSGFEAVVRRKCEVNKFIVKVFGRRGKEWVRYDLDGEVVTVLGDRDNIRGTLAYQLSHAGLILGSKRASVVHYFGVCSYRKLKVSVERRKQLCPICLDEFVHIRRCSDVDFELPSGSGIFVFDLCGSDGRERFIEAFASSER